jgi:ribosome small subunit-dependent GTPase A
LIELKDWCKSNNVTHIAMESTGIYWKPLFNILEEDFEIILVNARHVKNVPGHKTDKKDSVWLSKLLLSGLLKGSFIPVVDIRELRDLVRYKKKKTQYVSSEKNRMIKTLEDCNIKLSSVVSDTQGVSATKIINAIIDGEEDVEKLLLYAHGKLKSSKEELKAALKDKTSLLSGHSGVGKSTLLNFVEPTLNIKTKAISNYSLKGQHTTTFAEMHPLSFGGYIIDTPGIREFGLVDFKDAEVSHYFKEMQPIIGQCKYNNCKHVNEPGCAIQQAVTEGRISEERFSSYLSIISNEDIYE